MIALGGPKLKLLSDCSGAGIKRVSMIALGGPKLKPDTGNPGSLPMSFNDSTGWA